MGAYNWITFEGTCPACCNEAPIRAQTHVAASYDGDSSGRFHDRTYELDVVMAWWSRDDGRFGRWTENADLRHLPSIREACYSACQDCKADLCTVLEFLDLRATRVVLISLEAAWPESYSR